MQNLEVLGIASWRQNKKLKKPKKNQKNQRKPLTRGLGDGGSSQESQNIVYSFFLFWSLVFCFSKVVVVFSLGTSAKSLKILLYIFIFSHSFDFLGFLCDDHPE